MHCTGRGSAPGGDAWSGRGLLRGGGLRSAPRDLVPGGVCSWGVFVPRGWLLPGGVPAFGPAGGVSRHTMGQIPPCEQNHRHG